MHPFLDTSTLSDEEIINRLSKAYTFMNMQKQLGHNAAVQSIKEVIQALEDERQKRMQNLAREEEKRKNPNTNQSIDLGSLET
jgi:hypothetical protein